MHSFRSRILVLIIGLVVGTQIVTLVSVSARIGEDVRVRAAAQLQAAASIVGQLMEVRTGQLTNAVRVLAGDFGFREAVASADRATIISAMENQADRVHAGVAVVLSPDGKLLASTGSDAINTGSISWTELTARSANRDRPIFLTLGGKPYHVVIVPVKAPQLIAWVAMGFAVDDALAREVHKLVNLDVAFFNLSATTQRVAGSTRPDFASAVAQLGSVTAQPLESRKIFFDRDDWLVLVRPLDSQDASLQFALMTPYSVVMQPYDDARSSLELIGGTALLFALVIGVFLARSATQPVVELDVAARRIEEGNYSEAVSLSGASEFGRLAQTFNSMQRGISEREQQLRHLAYFDVVTELPNTRMAELEIDRNDAGTDPRQAIVVIELGGLEDVRATLGDSFRDLVLRNVAVRLREQLHDSTFLARLVPDSFMVILRGEVAAQATRTAARLCADLRRGVEVNQVRVVPNAVAGIALAPEHGQNSADLHRRALVALRSGKLLGKDVALFAPGSEEQFRRRLDLSAALPTAIETGQLFLHYQPKLDIVTRQVMGAEALVRWTHPELGMVSPAEFVPLAERTGTIRSLTRCVLRTGIGQLAQWREAGLFIDLSMNVSASDITDTDFASSLLADLRRANVPPNCLILELTETAVMNDLKAAAQHMELLRVAGIRFSIDDFGTGHSSLSLLQVLPVDELKIDRQFVRDLHTDIDSAKIVQSTIELARGLGLKVVAEGIESESAWKILRDYGCHYGQGFLLSAPLAPAEFRNFASRQQSATASHRIDMSAIRKAAFPL